MNIKHCDLCRKEISQIDRIYMVTYGEMPKGILGGNNIKKGEICYECCKKIESYIKSIKS